MVNIMNIYEQLKRFSDNQEGAVTVDFVVLTAGAVLIGVAATSALSTKVTSAVAAISL